jgi:hypothetical protein
MPDLWNPTEAQPKKDTTDYYLINEGGKVVQLIENNFGQAVKTAQMIMDRDKVKIQIVPRRNK